MIRLLIDFELIKREIISWSLLVSVSSKHQRCSPAGFEETNCHCGDGHMEEPPSDLEDMEMVLGQQLVRKWEPSSKGHESMNSVNNAREFESGSFPNQVSR